MEYHIRDVPHKHVSQSASKRMEVFYLLWFLRKELDEVWIPRKMPTATEGN